MKKALVIQRSKFGDIAQTLPALAGLRSAHPDWETWVLGRPGYLSLLEDLPFVDHVVSSASECPGASPDLIERCAEDLVRPLPDGTWELVANLSHDSVAGRVADLLSARHRAGLLVDARGERSLAGDAIRYLFGAVGARRLGRLHLSDIYRWAVDVQRLPVRFPLLEPAPEKLEAVQAKLRALGWDSSRQLVLLQLGTAAPERRWPVHFFARLGRLLAAFPRVQVALIGSSDERPLSEAYFQLAPGTAIDLIGQISIPELPALARLATTVVGADTGPTHMAAATGTPVIGVYHATAWVHETGPYGPGHVVLQADLSCSPCFQRTACAERPCASTVQPEHVVQAMIWQGILSEDEVPADFSDAPWNYVRAFVSEMENAVINFRQIAGHRNGEEELFASASRMAALQLWFGHPPDAVSELAAGSTPSEDVALGGLRDLLAFAELADQGAGYAKQILRSLRQGRKIGKQLSALARKLDQVDAGIGALGPAVALLRSYLVESQKLLPGGNLARMATESERAYAAASAWARLAASRLERWMAQSEEVSRGEKEVEPETVA